MEAWKQVWRDGFVPQFSTDTLRLLRAAVAADDLRLIQVWTTETDRPGGQLVAACAIGWCGWQGLGLDSVGSVLDFFGNACIKADELLNEPAACRHFLNWFDDTPRAEMLAGFLAELDHNLAERERAATDAQPATAVHRDESPDPTGQAALPQVSG